MKIKGILLLIVASMMLVGCSKEVPQTVPVDVENVEGQKEGIEVWGEVVATEEQDIVLELPARIEEIYVKEGQTLQAGEPLLRLDMRQYEQEVREKTKKLELEEVKLRSILNESSVQTQVIQDFKNKKQDQEMKLMPEENPELKLLYSDQSKHEKDLVKAKADLEVKEELYTLGVAAKTEWEAELEKVKDIEKRIEDTNYQIERIHQSIQAEIDELTRTINQKNTQLSLATEDEINAIEVQKIAVELARVDLESTQLKKEKDYLKDHEIIMNVKEGIVTHIGCTKGLVVGGGSGTVLISLLDTESMVVRADVPEEFVTSVTIGQEAQIIPYADKAQTLKGKVSNIADVAVKDNGETLVKVEITLEDAKEKEILKPGFSVDVKLME